ncbi:MAG: phosphatidylglycerol lysyltransferase domain-containing protein [Candidatus Omnitrophota bacterium]
MISEKLGLEHQTLLRDRLKNAGSFLSEFSFANLYLFREVHDYHVVTIPEGIFISGRAYDSRRFLMPAAEIRKEEADAVLRLLKEGEFIFPVPEEWLPAFDEKKVSFKSSEDDSDYIYTVEKLSTYQGQKLHGQKNLLNQFLSRYAPEARPLTQDRMDDARKVLEAWQEDVGEEKPATDYFPCREAFERYDELILCGGIYYVEGEAAGFIIGEEVRPDMFTLHFAKGKRKFKGLYQYMDNHFTKILPKQYAFLNFEQDLGKLALRIAKSSYHPDKVLKKYRILPLPKAGEPS